jgi:hypothetical protein
MPGLPWRRMIRMQRRVGIRTGRHTSGCLTEVFAWGVLLLVVFMLGAACGALCYAYLQTSP